MLIENEFTVHAPADDVYRLMLDVERVAPCIPGTEVLGRRDDGGFDAKVSMKMGPMSMGYKGSVAISEQDDEARRAVLAAKGAEQRGQGNAQATMTMEVTDLGAEGSRVKVSSDILVTGRVAQMGRGIMQDVATRMMGEMSRCMEATLVAAQGESPPASAEESAAGRAAASAAAPDAAPAAAAHATATSAPAEAARPAPPPPRPATPPAQAAPIKGGRLFLAVVAGQVRSLAGRVVGRVRRVRG
jgi:carbon monoxide dehydrogenase subunit G